MLYPVKVFLIRGNHEDRSVNKQYPRSPRQQYPHNTGCRCGPTHTHRRALVAISTAGHLRPSILLGCAAQAVPTLAVARLRYRTAGFVRAALVWHL